MLSTTKQRVYTIYEYIQIDTYVKEAESPVYQHFRFSLRLTFTVCSLYFRLFLKKAFTTLLYEETKSESKSKVLLFKGLTAPKNPKINCEL